MTPLDLRNLLRAQPFLPFRIHVSDGRAYDVRHPDMALVLATRVILPLPDEQEFSSRSEHLSIFHIARIEELSSGSTQSPDNSNHGN